MTFVHLTVKTLESLSVYWRTVSCVTVVGHNSKCTSKQEQGLLLLSLYWQIKCAYRHLLVKSV